MRGTNDIQRGGTKGEGVKEGRIRGVRGGLGFRWFAVAALAFTAAVGLAVGPPAFGNVTASASLFAGGTYWFSGKEEPTYDSTPWFFSIYNTSGSASLTHVTITLGSDSAGCYYFSGTDIIPATDDNTAGYSIATEGRPPLTPLSGNAIAVSDSEVSEIGDYRRQLDLSFDSVGENIFTPDVPVFRFGMDIRYSGDLPGDNNANVLGYQLDGVHCAHVWFTFLVDGSNVYVDGDLKSPEVNGYYAAGDLYAGVGVQKQVGGGETNPVPAPAALVLGFIGVGLVGLGRRLRRR